MTATSLHVLGAKPNIKMTIGQAAPLGATLTESGCNFAVYAPDAEKIWVCLFRKDTEEELYRFELRAKTGNVFHGHLTQLEAGMLYGVRASGLNSEVRGYLFDEDRLLIDPYAKQLNKFPVWNDEQYQQKSHFMIPKGVIGNGGFDWEGAQKPNCPQSQTVLYEAHVKGLTKLFPNMSEQLQGTYLGLAQPEVIKHIKSLGITSVQLLPVASFMAEPRLTELNLTNYWGYNPINFFAPDSRYAIKDAVVEFKEMVKTLHQNNIEVILDVVFNHTAEGGLGGPALSFKGLVNRDFYLFEKNKKRRTDHQSYVNNTGCGNSVNLDDDYTLQLILDALRYWADDMQVDGFRFDLAASLGRSNNHFNNHSAFFKCIAQDPILSKVKLIAEPWDIGYGGYQLGHFPPLWNECNDKYRDTIKGFWRGDDGLLSEFATRLLGSRDVFHKNHRMINTSVNYITYHDGFCLHDLVSYNDRHNLANGENNKDGHGHNLSFNYGIEGETNDHCIVSTRQKQKRNLIATLMFSQGMPHFLAGDEIGRTQMGNNNAYCQDNELSWVNWDIQFSDKKFFEFVKYCIAIRKKHAVLNSINLEDDNYFVGSVKHKVAWYRADGNVKQIDDWHDSSNQACAIHFSDIDSNSPTNHALLLIINASQQDILFTLPPEGSWERVLDTTFEEEFAVNTQCQDGRYLQSERSLSLWHLK